MGVSKLRSSGAFHTGERQFGDVPEIMGGGEEERLEVCHFLPNLEQSTSSDIESSRAVFICSLQFTKSSPWRLVTSS